MTLALTWAMQELPCQDIGGVPLVGGTGSSKPADGEGAAALREAPDSGLAAFLCPGIFLFGST